MLRVNVNIVNKIDFVSRDSCGWGQPTEVLDSDSTLTRIGEAADCARADMPGIAPSLAMQERANCNRCDDAGDVGDEASEDGMTKAHDADRAEVDGEHVECRLG